MLYLTMYNETQYYSTLITLTIGYSILSVYIYLLSTINFDFRGYSHVMMLTINCKATIAFLWLGFHRPCYIRDHAWPTSNYVE